MNTTKNDEAQSASRANRKSVHFPSASSLALLRSQVLEDESTIDVADSNTTAERESENESETQFSLVGSVFSFVTLPLTIPLYYIRTRPWLSGVSVLCLILVFIVIVIPGGERNHDGLGLLGQSFEFDVVTRFPEPTNRNLARDRKEELDSVIPASSERTSDRTRVADSNLEGKNKETVEEKNNPSLSFPVLLDNPFEERKVASNARDGAWLTGNIETIDENTIRKTVREEKKPKKHRIVLLPRIRK